MQEPQSKPNPYETIVLDREPEQPDTAAPTLDPVPADPPAARPSRARGLLLAGSILAVLLLGFLAFGRPRLTGADTQAAPIVQAVGAAPTAARIPTTAPTTAPTAAPTVAPAAAQPVAALVAPAAPAPRAIEIATLDGQWLFDQEALTASAGEKIALTFANGSKQRHNWVLVRGGDAVAARVNEAGANADVQNDYLPTDRADVVAATGLVRGGAVTLTFTAPAAGSYTYLCTVPGHYETGMRGTLTVR